jgi:hypothetical protein
MDETEFVLYEYVDLGAVEQLHRYAEATDGAEWTFEFTVEGVDIRVSSDGTVSIDD